MICQSVRDNLPDYLLGTLPEESVLALEAHLADCAACQQQYQAEQQLQKALIRHHQAPAPSQDFEARVLATATEGGGRRRYAHAAWGSAVAAALVLGIWIGRGPVVPNSDTASFEPVVQTVRLAFTSAEPLDEVTLTLELPPHVELSGLPGEQRISWQVSLQQGDNVLTLPLKVLFPGEGELIAELDAAGRQKVFRASVPPFVEGRSGSDPRTEEEPST
ncbi:MAG TPA: zf-HC2 domain-containing protein [Marinobacter sp.]|nr:zf-HC2 domain-containing protein [Marinobacter sp.]